MSSVLVCGDGKFDKGNVYRVLESVLESLNVRQVVCGGSDVGMLAFDWAVEKGICGVLCSLSGAESVFCRYCPELVITFGVNDVALKIEAYAKQEGVPVLRVKE